MTNVGGESEVKPASEMSQAEAAERWDEFKDLVVMLVDSSFNLEQKKAYIYARSRELKARTEKP